MTKPLYSLTDEHRARLPEFAKYGIDLALRCTPQTEEDRARAVSAAEKMYEISKLGKPVVVFSTSPIVGRFAAGFGTWLLHDPSTKPGPDIELDPTAAEAVCLALQVAGLPPREIRVKPLDTSKMGREWVAGVGNMKDAAEFLGVGKHGLSCAAEAWRMQVAGNMWSGWTAFQEFFRLVAKLDIDWSSWIPWKDLSETGGYRYCHNRFVIISDFPEYIGRDAANRAHCGDGPHLKWRDGTSCYSWHGIRVPQWILEHPETITVEKIHGETNAEVRRVMVEKYGMQPYLADMGAKPISEFTDEGGQPVRLYDVQGLRRLRLVNSTPDPDGTRREFFSRVPARFNDARQARDWFCQIESSDTFTVVS